MSSPATIAARVAGFHEQVATHLPAEALAVFAQEREEQAARSGDASAWVGRPMPDGDLLDEHGKPTSLAEARADRAAVVVYYRGAWCPYCNLTLRAYQESLAPQLDAAGVALIAISPQRPEEVAGAKEGNELSFTVLSDPGNQTAGVLGLLTETGAAARSAQADLGVDVAASNADGTQAIPMPTVVVLDSSGTIRWIDVHPDFTTRTEAADILEQVGLLSG
jgi:peroxiredoxin